MTRPPVNALDLLAEGFLYPEPARAARLRQPARGLPTACRAPWTRFLESAGRLDPAAWEELYTRTLDLNPVAAPYVGYQVYGEDYRRGSFMARMSAELERLQIPASSELADHLAPVLRYLARAETLPSDVLDTTRQALASMVKQLEGIDRTNPYRHLVHAARAAVGELTSEGSAP
ncbi:MAG: hypothetical protein P8Y02_03265 [Deinococcales bacterium]